MVVAVSSIYEPSVTVSQLLSIPTEHVSGKLDRNFRHFISAKEYLQQLKQMEGSISSCIRCIFWLLRVYNLSPLYGQLVIIDRFRCSSPYAFFNFNPLGTDIPLIQTFSMAPQCPG